MLFPNQPIKLKSLRKLTILETNSVSEYMDAYVDIMGTAT